MKGEMTQSQIDFVRGNAEISVSAALKETAIDEVVAELGLTDLAFQIAEETGVTREELIESEAYGRLDNSELWKRRDTGITATQLIADRIAKKKRKRAEAQERTPK